MASKGCTAPQRAVFARHDIFRGRAVAATHICWNRWLNVRPYNTREVDPYTRCRVILMNGHEFDLAKRRPLPPKHKSGGERK